MKIKLYINPLNLKVMLHRYKYVHINLGAGTFLARPGRKQARKHVSDARDFNNIETHVVKFLFLQGNAPKEIHAILTATLACFLPGRAEDLSAPLCSLYTSMFMLNIINLSLFCQ